MGTGASSWISDGLAGLQFVRHELLLFASFWFVIGAVEEFGVDCIWLWLRLNGRARSRQLAEGMETIPLSGRIAVFVPAWQEAPVLEAMIRHTLGAWRQKAVMLYVGCYRNDPASLAAAIAGAGNDPRVRIVVHDALGPTTKADCLNRLYRAMQADEARLPQPFRAIMMQDAEDMVHPAALVVIDRALDEADFVQLPVRPEMQVRGGWVSGHYADEFTEAHAKEMVVRDSLGAALPAAGVGCAIARNALARLVDLRRADGEAGPFAPESLTEDYELGLLLGRAGHKSRFLRVRDSNGRLVATRSYFPADLGAAVRQKTRWVHGIAFQGWERLGWTGRGVDVWMALRDRRGPLTALVLACAYLLLIIEAGAALAGFAGIFLPLTLSPLLSGMLAFSTLAFVWRACLRSAFCAREYGWSAGLWAIARIPLANVVAIMAGRRAFLAYIRSLMGGAVTWDKTEHALHPATMHAPAELR